jgi:CHAT domain-containing protein/tetratricopeptide (TPR) repeat protein
VKFNQNNLLKFIILNAFLLLISSNGICQLSAENIAIRDAFGHGKINPKEANIKWQNLEKKYGVNPITVENYGWRALTFFNSGNNSEAIQLFREGLKKAIEIKNDSLHFKYLSDLATIYRYSGELELTEKTILNAYQLYKQKPLIGKIIPNYAFSLFNSYGKFKQEIGDLSECIYYYKIAEEIAKPKALDRSKSFVYSNMASYFIVLNKLDSAKSYLKKALQYPANFEDISDKYLKLAEIEGSNKNWTEMGKMLNLAQASFQKSVKGKAGSIFPLYEIGFLVAKGKNSLGISDYKNSELYLNEAIKKGLKYYNTNATTKTLIECYRNKSILFDTQQKYLLALQNLHKALQYNSNNFKSDNIAENPKIEFIKYKNDAIEIFKEKIKVLLSIYKKEGKKQYLDFALNTAERVHELINYQRNSYQLEGSKLFLSEQAHEIYGLGIEAAFLKYKNTNDTKNIDLAFKYSESNKAVVLFESIKVQQKTTFVGVPQELIDQESDAIKKMAVFENQLYKDQKNETLWRKKLIAITEVLANLKEKFKSKYPAYYKFKYDVEPISIAEIQKNLTTNQAVLEYFTFDKALYNFTITANKSMFSKQTLAFDLMENIVSLRNQIINKSIDSHFQNLSFLIYKTVFSPQTVDFLKTNNIENLKIITDGELNYIPFESLLTKIPKSLKESNIYLLEKYIISYLPSATFNWKNQITKDKSWFPNKYVGFAPNFKEANDLPNNQANVAFLESNFTGESFLKEAATKINFEKESAKNTQILHISTHGGASPADPMVSYLAFAEDSLFVHEIYSTDIPTDLAILDACETGVGKLNNGEGVLNLARGFLHAGAQAVAMSLWKLTSSPETSEIIRDFAIFVQDGQPKDAALRNAKIKYLDKYRNNLVLSQPFYWSPLILVGHSEALEPNYFKYWLVLLLALVTYAYSSKRQD